jgi:hypothetical protein
MDIEDSENNQDNMDLYEMPSEELQKILDAYGHSIDDFKYSLYLKIVQKDTNSSPNSKDPLFDYHAKYLQAISFWISLLDHANINTPIITDPIVQDKFNKITNITNFFVSNDDSDYRILAYNILSKKSTEHPEFFNLNK